MQAAVFVRHNQKLLQLIDISFVSYSPFYKVVEEKRKEVKDKGKTIAQWIKLLRNNSFVH